MLFVRIVGRQKTYLGGATLIAPNKVLTVAHKFYRTYEKRIKVDNMLYLLFKEMVESMTSGTKYPSFRSGVESTMSRRKTALFHIRLQPRKNNKKRILFFRMQW